MSKQLTKGKTIGLQLPLDLDKHVRERAASAGLSPGLWITKRLNAVLRVERNVQGVGGFPAGQPLYQVQQLTPRSQETLMTPGER